MIPAITGRFSMRGRPRRAPCCSAGSTFDSCFHSPSGISSKLFRSIHLAKHAQYFEYEYEYAHAHDDEDEGGSANHRFGDTSAMTGRWSLKAFVSNWLKERTVQSVWIAPERFIIRGLTSVPRRCHGHHETRVSGTCPDSAGLFRRRRGRGMQVRVLREGIE